MHAVERLQTALVNTYTSGSHMVKTSVSMGISFYPRHGTTFTELYDKADIAMYHCKRNGKNGWTVYHGYDGALSANHGKAGNRQYRRHAAE